MLPQPKLIISQISSMNENHEVNGMARNIRVEKLTQTPIEKQEIEIVERKGVGHPDSMADGFAEAVSRALCNEYIKKCGTVLHHNPDQAEVVAGRYNPG